MATIVNDRDTLMQATVPRVVSGGASKGIVLSASSSAFQVSTAGVGSPSSIALSAALIGITGATVTFTTSPTTTLSISGNIATLAFSNMTSNSVAVTATVIDSGTTYSNTQTITKLNALGTLATQNYVNLSSQVTGYLNSGNITGLGALSALNYINLASGYVTGAIDASTQVNNLGALAFANSIAANQIGAGTLAAGVVYAGYINADKINANTTLSGVNISGGTINIASNYFRVYSDGSTSIVNLSGSNAIFQNTPNPASPAVEAKCTVVISSTPAFRASHSGAYDAVNATSSGGTAVNASTSGSGKAVSGSSSSGYGGYFTASSGTAVYASGATALYVDGLFTMPARTPGVNNTTLNSIIASTNNTYQCGYTGNAWQNVYTYGVINPSDIRIKENIRDLGDDNFGLDFIRKLRPISYTMIVGSNDIEVGPEQMGPWIDGQAPEREVTVIPRKGTRTHLGLPAQNVREAAGRGDVAIWSLADKDDPDSAQSVSYIELVAPTIKAVQQLDAIVQQLRAEIETLKAANG